LRISFASVIGYSPQDGLWSAPQTSVAGTLAKWVKHKGEKPFHLPERVRAAAANADASYWAAPHLGTVPACFLANADTTGGNSGSAAVNGRGELVGINFDRVWENIAGDFGYNPKQSRNILVDIRYVLWLLQVYDANQLLEELGVAQFTDAPPRRLDDAPRPPARNRVGCHVSRTPASPSTSLLWLSVLALAACRRKRRRSEWVASTIRRR